MRVILEESFRKDKKSKISWKKLYKQTRENNFKLKNENLERRDHFKRSSKEERREDALAPGAEEGRDKLRKAAERSKYPTTRRCPNGET